MTKMYLTLEEAQHIIPFVERRLLKLQQLQRQLQEIESVHFEEHDFSFEGQFFSMRLKKKYHYLLFHMTHELERLLAMGCIVKDLSQGLVDFYSSYQGRDIFLCWQLGEETIDHWHEIVDGFSGRKSIHLLAQQD